MSRFARRPLAKRMDGVLTAPSKERTIVVSQETKAKQLIELPSKEGKPLHDVQAETASAQEIEAETEVARRLQSEVEETRVKLQAEIDAAVSENSFDKTLVGRATHILGQFVSSDKKKLFGGIAKK